jgi:uncharacterized protein YybS (DUF2232 family)
MNCRKVIIIVTIIVSVTIHLLSLLAWMLFAVGVRYWLDEVSVLDPYYATVLGDIFVFWLFIVAIVSLIAQACFISDMASLSLRAEELKNGS